MTQDRIRAITTNGEAPATHQYDGDGDSPSWIDQGNGEWNRFLAGIDGNLAAEENSTDAITLHYANLHGDIVTSLPVDSPVLTSAQYHETTEYGLTRTGETDDRTYGRLGTKQRSRDTVAGLVLMGVRLYNPTTGRFLAVDPVPGGHANDYIYPADPINKFDLDGKSAVGD